ncbi:MAG: DNA primase [Patescibacteria group bacterium]|nr:DNA primase [Patescibacteria group bacterium]
MAGDTVQQVKDKLSIVDVVSQYVKLERSGSSLRARCPFHAEKTPSFFVSPERGTYHCFGCDTGGDIFSFVQAIEGLDFKGALKVLADKAGVEIVYGRGGKEKKDERDRLFEMLEVATIFYSSRLTNEAKKYLKERSMSAQTISAFRLGWAGNEWSELADHLKAKKFTEKEILEAGLAKKSERGTLSDKFRNRIMFPIADSAGRIVGFSGRTFPVNPTVTGQAGKTDGGFEPPKYMNSPETPLFHKSRILYGFDRAKTAMRKHNFAVLVEGQMDLLASHQAGWTNTLAVSGTAFTPEHATLIRRMTDNLVIALDADPAGIKAAGRAARAALQGGLNVKVAQLPDECDPADLIQKEGKEAWSRCIREATDIITFLLDVLEEHSKGTDWFRRSVESVVLPYLSDMRSPIAREQYVREIAERLGVSESAVADALAQLPRVPAQGGEARSDTSAASAQKEKADESPRGLGRLKQAYGILLWQRSLPKPQIDTTRYLSEMEEAAGDEAFKNLKKLPEEEQEALRFSVESLYGEDANLEREMQALLRVIHRQRLLGDLEVATMALKQAEKAAQGKEAEKLLAVCKMLTTRIAQLHEKV